MANEKSTPAPAPAPPKVPELPKIDSFTGPAKEQFQAIMGASKMLLDTIKDAKAVPIDALRNVRRGVNYAFTQELRSHKPDPRTRKRALLEKKIAQAQAALKELGIE